jgi:hypothetical protein
MASHVMSCLTKAVTDDQFSDGHHRRIRCTDPPIITAVIGH